MLPHNFLKQSVKRHGTGLSNELSYIIVVHGAANFMSKVFKMRPVATAVTLLSVPATMAMKGAATGTDVNAVDNEVKLRAVQTRRGADASRRTG